MWNTRLTPSKLDVEANLGHVFLLKADAVHHNGPVRIPSENAGDLLASVHRAVKLHVNLPAHALGKVRVFAQRPVRLEQSAGKRRNLPAPVSPCTSLSR
mgnify:CR=1 FL=1